MNPKKGDIISFKNTFPSNTVRTLCKGENNTLWIATFKGLIHFNTETNTWVLYQHNGLDKESLHHNVLWSLCLDNEGILWVGSMGRGICFSNLKSYNFSMPTEWQNKYRDVYINAFKYNNNSLLIATEDAGILSWNIKTKTCNNLLFNSSTNNNICYSIDKDKSNKLWIGTNNGVKITDEKGIVKQHILEKITEGYSIYSLVSLNNNTIICGGWNTGIIHFDGNKANIFKVENKNTKLPSNIIWQLFLDSKKRLWCMTNGGLGLWNYQSKIYTPILNDPNIFAVKEDIDGTILIGTSFGQVFCFNEKSGTINPIITLHSNYRIASLATTSSHIWIGTDKGLFRYDKQNKQVRRFTTAEGLPSNYFTWASYTLFDGSIIMGTSCGPIRIKSSYSIDNVYTPNLVITGIYVFDTKLKNTSSNIILPYNLNKITITFTSLSLANNGQTIYRYQLEGLDKKPIQTQENKAVYTNLSPGNYTFKVINTFLDGKSGNKPIEIHITIEAPWWGTWWFKIGCSLFLFSIIVLVMYIRNYKIRQRNKQLESEVKKRTIQLENANDLLHNQNTILQDKKIELERLNETKNKLFSIIGHDLKNPISVIIQLTDILSDDNKSIDINKQKEFLKAINHSSQNAYQLLLNLLDWARSQQHTLSLNPLVINPLNVISETVNLNRNFLLSKNITVQLTNNSTKNILTDSNLFSTCLRNILSNAIKFSYQNSTIHITISDYSAKEICIEVKDFGVGMSDDFMSNIFSINKESKYGTNNEKGTGLGLIIVKEFVSIMNGNISIESAENKGTTIKIIVPSSEEQPIGISNNTTISSINEPSNDEQTAVQTLKYVHSKTILIVDDDSSLRMSLKTIFEHTAHILEAENGKIAYDIIRSKYPDLIICDIEMPVMSGIELCNLVKTNAEISHIPFILLTARNTEHDIIKGLQTGADEYISKPFNKDILLLKIQQIFRLREDLHLQFKINETIEVKEGSINSIDEKLMQKIISLIQENISNPDFNVEQLSDKIGISRSHLSRKMNALTNMSTVDFIRVIRLKRALELLKTGKLSIAEVAYDTGFNDARYFSRCFKEYFGKIPSEYLSNKSL